LSSSPPGADPSVMKARGRGWNKAAIAAALAVAIVAFAVPLWIPRSASAYPLAAEAAPPAPTKTAGTERASAPRPGLRGEVGVAPIHAGVEPVTVVAVGDIACDPSSPEFNGGRGIGDHCRHAATARVVHDAAPDAVLTLGDQQYDDGLYGKFLSSYDLSWGAFRSTTYPVPGNHEYWGSPRASGYFQYFGDQAGRTGVGWYSADLGSWHIVALNSNCDIVGCGKGSPQYDWLERDLTANDAACTLAFWHHPRFSSGPHGPDTAVTPFWRLLAADGADIVLNGHDHIYERFRPQDPTGARDARGIREFVVGTGGEEHYPIAGAQPNSEVRNTDAFGVLELTLAGGTYGWSFVPALGASFADSGSGACV
jgi:calcineurin-like phosphoesterase family protein